jgi:methionine-rich copper-binding protein CopC
MSHRLRLASAATIVVLFAFGSASIAFAHAQYASSTPSSNATLSAAPATLGVTFTEELASIQIAISGPRGSEVTTDKASIDLAHRTNASVPLKDDGPGVYTVVWHNVSGDDGDPNDGSFTFTVAGTPPAAPSAPAAPAASAPVTATPRPPPARLRRPRALTMVRRRPVSTTCASTPTASGRRSATSTRDRSMRTRSTSRLPMASGWTTRWRMRWRRSKATDVPRKSGGEPSTASRVYNSAGTSTTPRQSVSCRTSLIPGA